MESTTGRHPTSALASSRHLRVCSDLPSQAADARGWRDDPDRTAVGVDARENLLLSVSAYGASAKVTTNAPVIPDTRVMMFLLLRSSAPMAYCRRQLLQMPP